MDSHTYQLQNSRRINTVLVRSYSFMITIIIPLLFAIGYLIFCKIKLFFIYYTYPLVKPTCFHFPEANIFLFFAGKLQRM